MVEVTQAHNQEGTIAPQRSSFSSRLREVASGKLAAAASIAAVVGGLAQEKALGSEPSTNTVMYGKPYVLYDQSSPELLAKIDTPYRGSGEDEPGIYTYIAQLLPLNHAVAVLHFREGWLMDATIGSELNEHNWSDFSYSLCKSTSTNNYAADIRSQTLKKQFGDPGFDIVQFPGNSKLHYYLDWFPKPGELILHPDEVLWGMTSYNPNPTYSFSNNVLISDAGSPQLDGSKALMVNSRRSQILDDTGRLGVMEKVEVADVLTAEEVPALPTATITYSKNGTISVSFTADSCPVVIMKCTEVDGPQTVVYIDNSAAPGSTVNYSEQAGGNASFYILKRTWDN